MASGNGFEVAKAFVTIVPTMEGSQKTIATELGAVTTEASEKAGEEGGSKFGEKFASALKTSAAVIAGALAAATGAAVASAKAFVDTAQETANLGDTIDKESQKVGLSAQTWQEYDYVLKICGTEMSSMTTGLKTLTNKLDDAKNGSEDAQEMFAALGISMEDISTMSREELFEKAIAGLQGMEDSTYRAALANDLFGKSGQSLAPLFNMTAEETQGLIDKAHDLGMVMSDEGVKASADYKDALTTLDGTIKGLKNRIMTQFMPGLTKITEGLAEAFSGKGTETLTSGIKLLMAELERMGPTALQLVSEIGISMIQGLGPLLPDLVSTIFNILISAITTITSMIPSMMPSIIEGIEGICQALFQALPIITSGLFDLIMALVMWLAEDGNVQSFITGILQLTSQIIDQFSLLLPILLPAIIHIIGEVCKALTEPDTIEMLINSVLMLFGAVIVALIEAVPELIDLVVGVVDNLGELLARFLDWAGDLVAQGIGAMVTFISGIGTKIRNGVSNFWTNTKNNFTNGINAIKNFVTNGLNSIKDKFQNIFETVKNTVKNALDKIRSFFDFSWELPHLDMPHFSISGSFSLDPPSVPRLSVDWYAKAMEEPMMLNGATIFGAANGKLLGGGEVGSEIIIGTDKLLGMMREAVGGEQTPIVINVYGAEGQDVETLANEIAIKLEDMTQRRGAVYA